MNLPDGFTDKLEAFQEFLQKLEENTESYNLNARAKISKEFQRFHLEMAKAIENEPQVYERAKERYRESVNPILKEGDIIRRSVDSPRGYHGDYEIMEMMYRNAFEGTSERGCLLHKMVVEGRECASVRERKRHLTSRIINKINKNGDSLSLCSIAAGPAAELRDIPMEFLNSIGKVVLVDQDEEALNHAFESLPDRLKRVCERVPASVADVVFRKVDACNGPMFDYVYSAGLFDYLDDATCKALIRRGIEMLRANGTLEVGNFAIWPLSFFADMSCGWKLKLRSEQDLHSLLGEGIGASITKVADQFFAAVDKSSVPSPSK